MTKQRYLARPVVEASDFRCLVPRQGLDAEVRVVLHQLHAAAQLEPLLHACAAYTDPLKVQALFGFVRFEQLCHTRARCKLLSAQVVERPYLVLDVVNKYFHV